MLKKDKIESAHLTSTFKSKKRKKDKDAVDTAPQKNNKKNQVIMKVLVVSSIELKGLRRSTALLSPMAC